MAQLANYVFLPWLRQGIGNQIADKDTLGSSNGSLEERATLLVDVTLSDTSIDGVSTHQTTFSKNIYISGPGDVMGIQQRAIVRTEPPANLSNFESNNLAYIEFYEEDFLWRYTPANADIAIQAAQRLRPWLALVVLKDEEFKLIPNPNGLAFISLADDKFDNAFHNHTDTWAFGHVHLNHRINDMSVLNQDVAVMLSASPDAGVSRLLCPRKLSKNTSYTAFLIPAFETGRLSGLGLDPSKVKSQEASWQKGTSMKNPARLRAYDFPIYYSWNFKTGNFGDFESLAAILKPIIIDGASNGTIAMDIQDPGYGLSGVAETKIVGFEGALRPPNFESAQFPKTGSTGDQNFKDGLKDLLNLSSDLVNEAEAENIRQNTLNPFYTGIKIGDDDPIIVPPVYGVWHIMAQKVGALSNPQWFNSLNLDPRFRAAAGLGTKVVQDHQEDFMNRAWQQVDEVNEANKKIRQAELIKMVANSLFKKHIATADNDKVLTLTHAVHSFFRTTPDKTLQQDIKESRVPVAAKTPAFQKLIRPTRKNDKLIPSISKAIISKFNAIDPLTAASLKTAALGVIDTARVTAAVTAAVTSYQTDELSMAKDLFFTVAKAQQVSLNNPVNTAKTILNNAVDAVPIAQASAGIKTAAKNIVAEILQIQQLPENTTVTIITLKKAKYEEVFYTNNKGEDAKSFGLIEVRKEGFVSNAAAYSVGSVSMFSDVKEYENNFTQFWNAKSTLKDPALLPQLQSFNSLNLQLRVFPEITFSNRLLQLLLDKDKQPLGNLKPVMAYPIFKEAVYNYLLELSKDYILPNVDKLERNSIALLETNPKFIESFLMGMNHEMASELLWREYPTDQRGSYFRQFWSIKDSQIFPKPAEELLDIKEIHKWKGELGDNGRGSILVLILRGELLQKYPDTMIYAQKAAYASPDPKKPRLLPDDLTENNTKFPLFRAEIEPDITLVGFELTAEQAIGYRITKTGESIAGKDPGWFFVLKQRPGHLSFGFDDYVDEHGNTNGTPPAPQKWENLTWENLVNQKTELDNYHLSFNKNFNPPTNPQGYTWNKNAADLAAILFQNPVIFSRHAAEMLPEL